MSSINLEGLEIKEATPSIAPSIYESFNYTRKWKLLLAIGIGVCLIGVCVLVFYVSAESKRPKGEVGLVGTYKQPIVSSDDMKKWRTTADGECLASSHQACPKDFGEVPVFILVVGGLRTDQVSEIPALNEFMKCGASVRSLVPSYPSYNYPNLYSIATGLYPESHGIVSYDMYDEKIGANFSLGSPTEHKAEWWNGEPLWNTLGKNGKKSATYLWPGSDVRIGGMYPTYWQKEKVDITVRIKKVIDWIQLPAKERPSLIMMYYEEPVTTAQQFGPFSPRTTKELSKINAGLDELMSSLERLNLFNCVNIIVASDHGVAASSCENSVNVKDLVGEPIPGKLYAGTVGRIDFYDDADQSTKDRITEKLQCKNSVLKVLKKHQVPKRYHYTKGPRIGDLILDTRSGSRIATDSDDDKCLEGEFGFDILMRSMQGIFVGHGPVFQVGYHRAKSFRNVEIYNLLSHILDVKPAPNNGTKASLLHTLKKSLITEKDYAEPERQFLQEKYRSMPTRPTDGVLGLASEVAQKKLKDCPCEFVDAKQSNLPSPPPPSSSTTSSTTTTTTTSATPTTTASTPSTTPESSTTTTPASSTTTTSSTTTSSSSIATAPTTSSTTTTASSEATTPTITTTTTTPSSASTTEQKVFTTASSESSTTSTTTTESAQVSELQSAVNTSESVWQSPIVYSEAPEAAAAQVPAETTTSSSSTSKAASASTSSISESSSITTTPLSSSPSSSASKPEKLEIIEQTVSLDNVANSEPETNNTETTVQLQQTDEISQPVESAKVPEGRMLEIVLENIQTHQRVEEIPNEKETKNDFENISEVSQAEEVSEAGEVSQAGETITELPKFQEIVAVKADHDQALPEHSPVMETTKSPQIEESFANIKESNPEMPQPVENLPEMQQTENLPELPQIVENLTEMPPKIIENLPEIPQNVDNSPEVSQEGNESPPSTEFSNVSQLEDIQIAIPETEAPSLDIESQAAETPQIEQEPLEVSQLEPEAAPEIEILPIPESLKSMSLVKESIVAVTVSELGALHCPWGFPGFSAPEVASDVLNILPHSNHFIGLPESLSLGVWTSFTLTKKKFEELQKSRPKLPEGIYFSPEKRKLDLPVGCWTSDSRLERSSSDQCSRSFQTELYKAKNASLRQLYPEEFERRKILSKEGFLLSNLAPLMKGFENGGRKTMIEALQKWTTKTGPVNVVHGPVFDYDFDGRRDDITVIRNTIKPLIPSDYFYVVSVCNETNTSGGGSDDSQSSSFQTCPLTNLNVYSFVFPNIQEDDRCFLTDREYLQYHMASVADVEDLTSLRFFKDLSYRDYVEIRARQPLRTFSY